MEVVAMTTQERTSYVSLHFVLLCHVFGFLLTCCTDWAVNGDVFKAHLHLLRDHTHACLLWLFPQGTRKIKAKTESKEQTGPHQSRRRRKGKTTSNQVRININFCSLHTSQRNGPCFLETLETRAVSSSLDLIVYRGCFLYIDMNHGLHTLIWIKDSSGLNVCCGIMHDAVFSFSLWVC